MKRQNRNIKLVVHTTKAEAERMRQTAKGLNMSSSEFFRQLYNAYIADISNPQQRSSMLDDLEKMIETDSRSREGSQ
jgi:hypothetical protein